MKQALAILLFDFRRSWRTDRKMSYGAHLIGLLLTGAIVWFPVFTVFLFYFPYTEWIHANAWYIVLSYLLGFLFWGFWWYVLIFRLLARHRDHAVRKNDLWDDFSRFCTQEMKRQGIKKEDNPDLAKRIYSLELFANEYKKAFILRHPGLWTFLTFVSFGIVSYVVAFFLMQDLQRMQQFEEEYLQVLSDVLIEMGILTEPVIPQKQIPYREYGIFLALSIVSGGLFWFYWWYILVKDGNCFFDMTERWETEIHYSLLR